MRLTLQDDPPQMLIEGDSVVVERAMDVRFVDGKPTTTASQRFIIRASVQPLSGRELQILPEGDRIKTLIWVYTASPICVNDIFVVEGARYQAQTVESWPGHFKSKAAKIDVGEYGPL